MTQENFRKLFPDIGKSFRKSLRVMTRFWEKIFFLWVSTHEIYLEIVFGKSLDSRPKIAKSGKSFRDLPIWVNRVLNPKMRFLTENLLSSVR